MLILKRDYEPNERTPRLRVTDPLMIRCTRPGEVEVIMGQSWRDPRGVTRYRQMGSLIWPIETLIPSRLDLDVAFDLFFRREVNQ